MSEASISIPLLYMYMFQQERLAMGVEAYQWCVVVGRPLMCAPPPTPSSSQSDSVYTLQIGMDPADMSVVREESVCTPGHIYNSMLSAPGARRNPVPLLQPTEGVCGEKREMWGSGNPQTNKQNTASLLKSRKYMFSQSQRGRQKETCT